MRDLDGPRSLTNDMEKALAEIELQSGHFDGSKIIYRDSSGIWDGVSWPGRGHLANIYSLGGRNESEAIILLKKHLYEEKER